MSAGATARSVLEAKPVPLVHTCTPATTVKEAANVMSVHRVGALLVTEAGALRGIFTERDVLMRVVAQGRDPDSTTVEEVMTCALITITPDSTLDEVERIMRDNRIRHLPVLKDKELVAVLSIGDVVAFHAASRQHMVEQLTDYVAGNYR